MLFLDKKFQRVGVLVSTVNIFPVLSLMFTKKERKKQEQNRCGEERERKKEVVFFQLFKTFVNGT